MSEHHFEYLNQWKWCASLESRGTKYYAVRFEKGKKIRMHRAIIERMAEAISTPSFQAFIPPGYVVDHINHNSLDNRQENLEVVTQTENMARSKNWKRKGEKYNHGASI